MYSDDLSYTRARRKQMPGSNKKKRPGRSPGAFAASEANVRVR